MDRREFKKKMDQSTSRERKIALLDAYAEELFGKDKFTEASRYYTQAFRMEELQNARAYFAGQVGICQYNLGNDTEAYKHLSKSTKLFDPNKPEFMPDMYGFVHFHLGSLFEYQGKVTKSLEARRVCEQYINSQEKDTKWMLYAGVSRNYESLGKHKEAIQYSEKAIQVLSDNDPGLVYLYESMANNHMGLKQYAEAVKYFSKVLDMDPNFERRDEIHLKVANCYYQLTNHQMALESYKKILEVKQLGGKRETLAWLYIEIAHCHFCLEQFDKSFQFTQEGLRRRQKSDLERAELRSYLTNNDYELGRFAEAVAEGEKTLKLTKRFRNDHLFYFRLAMSYLKVGDRKNFARYRNMCGKMFPNDSWNHYLEKLK